MLAKAVPNSIRRCFDRRNTKYLQTTVLQEVETEPHIDRAEKLVLEPQIHFVVRIKIEQFFELPRHSFAIHDRVAAEFDSDKIRARFPEFLQRIAIQIAGDQSFPAHDDLAYDACVLKGLYLSVAG